MYAAIVVDAPSSPNIDFYTYKVPEKLTKSIKIGHFVSVPFGSTEISGWVLGIGKKKPDFEIKEVYKILYPLPVILPNYIKLVKWMSWYYQSPLLDCMKLVVPVIPKRQLSNKAIERLSDEAIKLLSNVDKQKIILVPEIDMIPKLLEKEKLKAKDITIYHNGLTSTDKFLAWKKIYRGGAKIIIGSRSAIFASCSNLSEIRITHEHSPTYQDERSPYYHSQTVAAKLASITGAKLILESQTPRVETFFSARQSNNSNQQIKLLKSPSQLQAFKKQIIDMNDEIIHGNRSSISAHLRYSLLQKLKENKKNLLFLNKKKESGQIYCFSCKTSCFVQKEIKNCSQCQSEEIKFWSLNIFSLASQVKKLFPQSKIELVTENLENKKTTPITIATQVVLGSRKKFDLGAIVQADSLLNLPDFRSGEKLFQLIWYIQDLIKPNGQFIIQTHNPKHPTIITAIEKNYKKFFAWELKERKTLSYPPFSTFSKITLEFKREEKTKIEAEKLFTRIQAKIIEEKLRVQALGPLASFLTKKDKNRYNIVLKAKRRKEFDPIFKMIGKNFKIEVDPKDLL